MNASPEILLAVECTRKNPDHRLIRSHFGRGISWMRLIQFAIVHGVLPLVAITLRDSPADLIPHDVRVQFDRALKRTEARNQRHWVALAEVMQAFAEKEVRLLAFKGPALTSLAYGDLRLRESHDLDLWAAPEDIVKAGEILRSIGYLPVVYTLSGPAAFRQSSVQQMDFTSADGDIAIDLQGIRRQYYFNPDFDELWEHRSMAIGPGVSIPTLSKENCLLALAVHGEKHSWRRLNWIVDVDRLLSSSTPRWESIFASADRWRCRRRLCSALAIRSKLYNAPLAHSDAAKYLTDWTTHRVLASVLQTEVTDTSKATLLDKASALFSHHRLIDRRHDRLHHLSVELASHLMKLPLLLRGHSSSVDTVSRKSI